MTAPFTRGVGSNDALASAASTGSDGALEAIERRDRRDCRPRPRCVAGQRSVGFASERACAKRLPTSARTLLPRMPSRPSIAYQPALDGVRAVAVSAVLLFHGGVPGFEGGYLGVSVFFTLSGYLITSLLLHEHQRSGTIDLPGFYTRRLRRLLPASMMCLGGRCPARRVHGPVRRRREPAGRICSGRCSRSPTGCSCVGDGSYQDLLAAYQRNGVAGRTLLVARDRRAVLLGVAAVHGVHAHPGSAVARPDGDHRRGDGTVRSRSPRDR